MIHRLRSRPVLATATALALALALGGCGEFVNTINPAPGTANELTVQLDAAPNADQVGIYEAQSLGYFKQADLDVHIIGPANPRTPLAPLASGKVSIAITNEPDLFLAREHLHPLVAVGAIVQQPLSSIISLASQHITSVKDLAGKTVGDSELPYEQDFLPIILGNAGLTAASVKAKDVGADLIPELLAKKVDAVFGASWNLDALQLAQDKKKANVIRIDQAGVPSYDELVIAIRKREIVLHASLIRRFVQAVARGYRAARANPVAATEALVQMNPGLNDKLELAAVRETMSSFFPTGGHVWGYMSNKAWNAFGTWMINHHLILNPNAVINASTNELLAGQGV